MPLQPNKSNITSVEVPGPGRIEDDFEFEGGDLLGTGFKWRLCFASIIVESDYMRHSDTRNKNCMKSIMAVGVVTLAIGIGMAVEASSRGANLQGKSNPVVIYYSIINVLYFFIIAGLGWIIYRGKPPKQVRYEKLLLALLSFVAVEKCWWSEWRILVMGGYIQVNSCMAL